MASIKRKAATETAPAPTKKFKSQSAVSKPAKPYQKDSKSSTASKSSTYSKPSTSSESSTRSKPPTSNGDDTAPKQFKLETSSAEAHAKQRALAKERRASKPNADIIARSKKLWEQLRRKSHVTAEERKKLVAELFEILQGRVQDFVFKHDSVRVVQCALKYANLEQRRSIAQELQGDIRTLAESRYGKFLVAKMITSGDQAIRDLVVPEFYGHVRRLINHPEASWIVDDIYRQIATPEQKATMLREWYGAEFALFHRQGTDRKEPVTSDGAELAKILESSPEKRKPMLHYLHDMINGLIQKKMTGFTMLHDAMLQYVLALQTGGEEQRAFLEEMLGDVDAETEGGGGDLYKNLAFTQSGSRLVCLALAYGTPKERKVVLRVYRDNIETMAFDQHAKMVLIAGLDLPDDTQMTIKSIYRELLAEKIENEEDRLSKLEAIVLDQHARVPVMYPMQGLTKALFSGDREIALLQEVHAIRESTSKKAPETRRKELLQYLSPILLGLLSNRALSLVSSSFGWQFVVDALFELNSVERDAAKDAVVQLAAGNPTDEDHIAQDPAAGRTLKTLVGGGPFDRESKTITLVEPRLQFGEALWPIIKEHIVDWACSPSSFVVLALLESEDVSSSTKAAVKTVLKKDMKRIKLAAESTTVTDDSSKKNKGAGNPGARLILAQIA